MDLDEKIMMDLVNKSEKIIDDILKNMSFSDYNLLVDEINNLPNNIKEKNKKIMNRVNEIKKKYIKNIKSGGDGNRSRFVLIPLAELFLKKNLHV